MSILPWNCVGTSEHFGLGASCISPLTLAAFLAPGATGAVESSPFSMRLAWDV